ncbi:hypothetical protein Dester_0818 [Desulfurobacterium thermolithotrophum DSM 11699]|uniref:4Fe-4S ferredoxin-type domain-containing protein n=1 Tax=Desulfurobacterium thermolithotrophum (strain DSM 11699 / BSA) TaxID=868864 RepID=F0S3N7_DESTD|nr:ferredoxin family protein [Desulfurobacterium thermolithotrophum]ADY73459.1 hypothetical protein Dester_0818 [Desulfurobacterium thermolithotrophum DSM 11699]
MNQICKLHIKQEILDKVKRQVILCQDGSLFIPQYPGGIDYSKCTGCGKCVEVCPQGCIKLEEVDGKLVAIFSNWELCIGDGICKIICPENAFL